MTEASDNVLGGSKPTVESLQGQLRDEKEYSANLVFQLEKTQEELSEAQRDLLERSTKLLVCSALMQKIAEAVAVSAGEPITEQDMIPTFPDGLTPLTQRVLPMLIGELDDLAKFRSQAFTPLADVSKAKAQIDAMRPVLEQAVDQLSEVSASLIMDESSMMEQAGMKYDASSQPSQGQPMQVEIQDASESAGLQDAEINPKQPGAPSQGPLEVSSTRPQGNKTSNRTTLPLAPKAKLGGVPPPLPLQAASRGSNILTGRNSAPMQALDAAMKALAAQTAAEASRAAREGLQPKPVTIVPKRCECGLRRPSLGIYTEGQKVARWCSKCPGKPATAVNVRHRRCVCGSSITPIYGLPGEQRKDAKWCAKCPERPLGAVNVASKRCECGAGIGPAFGLPGESHKDARWCARCPGKPPNAVDVRSKRCECGQSQPSFGYAEEGRRSARWCSKCPNRPDDAVDVVHRRRARDVRSASTEKSDSPPGKRLRQSASAGEV